MNQNNNSLNNIFKSGMFTSTPQKDPTPSPFGTNTSVFGSSQQQPFGSSNVFQSSTGLQQSPFGQQPSTGFQTPFQQKPQGQGGVFGALGSSGTVQPLSNTQFGGFGNNTQFGGNTNTSTFGTSTPFGSNQQQQPFGSSALGGTQQQPFGTTTSFGSTQPSFTTTQQPSFTTQQQQPTFGSTTGWSSSTSVFGSAKPSLSFGNSIGSLKNGSRDIPYQDTRVKDGIGSIDIKHINAMNEYSRKSNDEVRHEDYNLGRKAITSGAQTSFGGSTPTALGGQATTCTTSPFGSSTTTPFLSTPQTTTTTTTPQFVNNPQTSVTSPFVSTPQNTTPFLSSTNPFLSNTTPSNSTPSNTTTSFPSATTTSFPSATNSFPGANTTSFPGNTTTTFPSNTSSTFPGNNTTLFPGANTTPFPTNTTTSFPSTTSTFPDTNNFNTTFTTPRQANYDDPFLLKDIKFERVEKKTSSFPRVVPKPIFSDSSKKPLLNLSYRPPRVNQKKKIYTEPSIEEARHLKEIESLVIGFDGKGRIQYLDKISGTEVTTSNIEDKISFMKNEVVVSDPPGVGFNKRARVYVEGVFAFSKSLGDFIVGKAEKNPLKAIQERFIYSLKEDPFKKFIDYNYETGLYVYEVNHF